MYPSERPDLSDYRDPTRGGRSARAEGRGVHLLALLWEHAGHFLAQTKILVAREVPVHRAERTLIT